MRRLNVTEGLLFVVLWGGNESSEGGKREQDEGRRRGRGRQREQSLGRGQSCMQTGVSPPNKQQDNETNAAQETASTREIKQLWHKIKCSARRRSTLHTQVNTRVLNSPISLKNSHISVTGGFVKLISLHENSNSPCKVCNSLSFWETSVVSVFS